MEQGSGKSLEKVWNSMPAKGWEPCIYAESFKHIYDKIYGFDTFYVDVPDILKWSMYSRPGCGHGCKAFCMVHNKINVTLKLQSSRHDGWQWLGAHLVQEHLQPSWWCRPVATCEKCCNVMFNSIFWNEINKFKSKIVVVIVLVITRSCAVDQVKSIFRVSFVCQV